MNQARVIAKLQRMCSTQTQRQVASALDISPQYLCDILAGRREPGPLVLTALGLTRTVTYKLSDER